MIISKTKGKRILLVHDLCDHNTLDESALDKLSNVLGEHEIEVQTNVPLDRWSAQSNAEWCKVVQHEGKVVVSASANNIYKQRRAEITVAYGHQSYSITVSQFGKEPAILIGDKLQQEGYVEIIDAERETLTIPVATNLNLDNIIIPDTCNWIRLAHLMQRRVQRKT